jgi:hypothetical protein
MPVFNEKRTKHPALKIFTAFLNISAITPEATI